MQLPPPPLILLYLNAQDTNTLKQVNDSCKLHDSRTQLQPALKESLILPCNLITKLTIELFYLIKSQA